MSTESKPQSRKGSRPGVDPGLNRFMDTQERLNRENGVVERVEDLRGWHLVEAELRKPGVYRIVTNRYTNSGAELRHGFASQRIITTARELGYLSAPNGFTLPNH